mmetsp:Transcript_148019/g.475271  ORF Transcript_148019/g.475271 Transcript_148019/m.475271 type:complete len:457 (+) Transcript_148019:111-1481(+)
MALWTAPTQPGTSDKPRQARHPPTPPQFPDTYAALGQALDACDNEQVTSLMMRNLPRKYTVSEVLMELSMHVPREAINFVSVPWDMQTRCNVGFAFVSFTDPSSAARVFAAFDGNTWKLAQSAKKIKALSAHVQGLAKNILHCGTALPQGLDTKYFPIVLLRGQQVDFSFALSVVQQRAALETGPQQTEKAMEPQAAPKSTRSLSSRLPFTTLPRGGGEGQEEVLQQAAGTAFAQGAVASPLHHSGFQEPLQPLGFQETLFQPSDCIERPYAELFLESAPRPGGMILFPPGLPASMGASSHVANFGRIPAFAEAPKPMKREALQWHIDSDVRRLVEIEALTPPPPARPPQHTRRDTLPARLLHHHQPTWREAPPASPPQHQPNASQSPPISCSGSSCGGPSMWEATGTGAGVRTRDQSVQEILNSASYRNAWSEVTFLLNELVQVQEPLRGLTESF